MNKNTVKIDRLVHQLSSRYKPDQADASQQNDKDKYLSHSIIPTDLFAYSGSGSTLQTNQGELIDFSSMTVNCILGQNDPWVTANLIAYLYSDRPSFLTTRIGSDFYFKVARRIVETMPIEHAVLNHRQCNGSDVTELAVLASYLHRSEGSNLLGSFDNSYHGQNLTAYLMSGLQAKHRFLVNDAGTVFFPPPSNTLDIHSSALTKQDRLTLERVSDVGDELFALIIEPIQVNNNVNTPSSAFFRELSRIAKERKFALIFDEVQTGFGWLGAMSGAQLYGVSPDHIALSKALTAGYGPLSALVSKSIYQDVRDGSGAKTNGADMRSLVASNAVMDRLLGLDPDQIPSACDDKLAEELKRGLLSNHATQSTFFYNQLKDLVAASNDRLGTISGYGLIWGVSVMDSHGKPSESETAKLQSQLLQSGLLVRHSRHSLIFKPSINITMKEVERGFDIFSRLLNNK